MTEFDAQAWAASLTLDEKIAAAHELIAILKARQADTSEDAEN